MLATVERAELARRLIDATIAEHDVDPTALTVHSDRGVPAAKPVAQLLADLEITRSVTRPRTPNDNPYSEAQFPTMKYRPTFPDRFAGIDASVPLVDIARRRVPHGDLRAGDMFALPWDDASFDVVTSFNGIWGGCTDALREARRVLRDGGTIGLTFWGPGSRLDLRNWFIALGTSTPHVADEMKSLADIGAPGVVEGMLTASGFTDIERTAASAVLELPDESTTWRALRSPGLVLPALEAHGEDVLRRRLMAAVEQCRADDGSYRIVNELTCVTARAV